MFLFETLFNTGGEDQIVNYWNWNMLSVGTKFEWNVAPFYEQHL